MPGFISMIDVDHQSPGDLFLALSVIENHGILLKRPSSYRTVSSQLLYAIRVVSQLLENRVCIGSQDGRRRAWRGIAARQPESCTHDIHVAIDARCVVKMFHETPACNLWVLEHFGYR